MGCDLLSPDGASTAFAYTFAVMNTVHDPQNFARALDCCKGDVFADRVVLLEIQFRAGRGAECAALHRPLSLLLACGLPVHDQVLVQCTLS